jgi:hypothetical protein
MAVCLSVWAGHASLDSPGSGLVPDALAQLSEFWAAIWILSWPFGVGLETVAIGGHVGHGQGELFRDLPVLREHGLEIALRRD